MAAVTADKFKQLAFVRQVKEVLKALDKPESGASTLQAFLECHDPSEPATSDLLKDEKSAEVIRSSVMLDVLVECLDPERKAPHPLHVLGLLRCLALIGPPPNSPVLSFYIPSPRAHSLAPPPLN